MSTLTVHPITTNVSRLIAMIAVFTLSAVASWSWFREQPGAITFFIDMDPQAVIADQCVEEASE